LALMVPKSHLTLGTSYLSSYLLPFVSPNFLLNFYYAVKSP
jgi:hypothetical protein